MTASDPVTPEPPKRRVNMLLDLGADNYDELADALRRIAINIEMGERPAEQTSGGWASGHHFTITVDEDMDGDRFREEIAAWLTR